MLPTLASCAKAVYTAAPSNPNRFKRAGRGLFAGRLKLFGATWVNSGLQSTVAHSTCTGNNVPESNQKTRRTWTPNVQRKRLYSASLDESIPIKMTMAALRDVDKAGGLDEYLLKPSAQKHLGDFGQRLKDQILEARRAMAQKAELEKQSTTKLLEGTTAKQLQIDQAFKQARRIGPAKSAQEQG